MLWRIGGWVKRQHFVGSVLIVVFSSAVISSQVEDRTDFADTELVRDVESRWGAPVDQPAPSLRFVQSGTIFTELKALPFEKQHVQVDAEMNYRKRGLRYFSGFDFDLTATCAVVNRETSDIDVAFIFPIEVNKSQVLLSELQFRVNGDPNPVDLGEGGNRLLWTGRISKGATAEFVIKYRARGLDSFVYRLDPALPARDVRLHIGVKGGENFDYPANVLSAQNVTQTKNAVTLDWLFPSLESGVALGVVLPSQQAYDATIGTMARRAWVPFLAFFAVLVALGVKHGRSLLFFEAYLLAAAYGFFFVLLAYLAAFMPFSVAYVLSLLVMGVTTGVYVKRLYPRETVGVLAGLWMASMGVPTIAVVLEGYTGLIYTLEILGALLAVMSLSMRQGVRSFFEEFSKSPATQEVKS